ncbi:ndufs4 NADH dehydrogenase Fe-S protein subunit [Rhizina undulata]
MSFARTSRLLIGGNPRLPLIAIRAKSTSVSVPATVPSKSARETSDEVAIDHATSVYTPIVSPPPPRGPEDPLAAYATSGAPVDLQGRVARIYKPAKPATQSGDWNTRHWRMDWDVLPKGHRWENPLMGWQSSGDYMQGTHMFFKTKEDAISFAEKQGYQWFVQEPNERKFKPKSYAQNFYHVPGKLKFVYTK